MHTKSNDLSLTVAHMKKKIEIMENLQPQDTSFRFQSPRGWLMLLSTRAETLQILI